MSGRCDRTSPKPSAIRWESLALVNRARRGFGLADLTELPAGVPGEPEDCPLKRGLRPLDQSLAVLNSRIICGSGASAKYLAKVWGGQAKRCKDACYRGQWECALPAVMGLFVSGFDNRHRGYRHLIDHGGVLDLALSRANGAT